MSYVIRDSIPNQVKVLGPIWSNIECSGICLLKKIITNWLAFWFSTFINSFISILFYPGSQSVIRIVYHHWFDILQSRTNQYFVWNMWPANSTTSFKTEPNHKTFINNFFTKSQGLNIKLFKQLHYIQMAFNSTYFRWRAARQYETSQIEPSYDSLEIHKVEQLAAYHCPPSGPEYQPN